MKKENGRKFLSSLYRDLPDEADGSFDVAVTRLIDTQGKKAVAGDQALQSLMIHYLTSDPKRGAVGREISAAVAGIKMAAVSAFSASFPDADLETLIREARSAGHHVEVLG
ncbi:hypothetical protein A9995_11710 [Erythrobacter sp. QSSC1-22B]|uniref:hypothetical protein n=1 Tax=Erythrobacter sp. QSSC1-22B TaxID=1860125 RepID=UPI000804C8A0|nr:hypothetical protein [Erythrobacter sp. QSSC1-22B]OBX18615.1 hypothetical protein A9995_11710 [Erythrobacter sp. QSSC1-22B]